MGHRHEELLLDGPGALKCLGEGVDGRAECGEVLGVSVHRVDPCREVAAGDGGSHLARITYRSGESPTEPSRHHASGREREGRRDEEPAGGNPDPGLDGTGENHHGEGVAPVDRPGRRHGPQGASRRAAQHLAGGERFVPDLRVVDL